jgi:putative ABC transport system permease protein
MNNAGFFTMAWRNLWRNRRRSLATIASIACGLAAIAVFGGYMRAIYNGLGNIAIHADLVGHLTLNKTGWLTQGRLHPARYMLDAQEIARLRTLAAEVAPGVHVVERMSAMGLMSNGHQSTIFLAGGLAPDGMRTLRGPFQNSPGLLRPDSTQGVTIAEGLAEILGLTEGSNASILVSTIHGQANAADVDIDAIINTGNLATNDKWVTMPLELAREQMDAIGYAESLTLLLPAAEQISVETDKEAELAMYNLRPPTEAQTESLRARLADACRRAGLDVEIYSWQEMSPFYTQVKSMFDMMFGLLLGVVLAIVALAIVNAMGMAVVERTREIGTLRAIGMRRSGVTRLFVTEAVLLVLVGLVAGLLLTWLVRLGVNALDIRYIPPSHSRPVQLYVGFDALRTALAAGALAVLATVAAFIPARRAARNPIIASLGHV